MNFPCLYHLGIDRRENFGYTEDIEGADGKTPHRPTTHH